MPRVCHFTGKNTRTGNKYRLRGRPKYLGGVGTKITSCTKRTFKTESTYAGSFSRKMCPGGAEEQEEEESSRTLEEVFQGSKPWEVHLATFFFWTSKQ